ncbi:P-loop containing nucleoside triphosphate hydrolase superfamily protein [Trifolium repens]|nr:P-loop containing nucleoside triphosphate hydrolase superfamily protein [Trifolium repens]
MNPSSSTSRNSYYDDHNFINTIFSWSLQDIFNQDFYKHQVKCIELRFKSVGHYFGSYVYPLLEETRTQLCSSMENLQSSPFAEVVSLKEAPDNKNRMLYNVRTNRWRNRSSGHGNEMYKTLTGDVFILADFKPEIVDDLQRMGKMWTLVVSAGVVEEETNDHNAELMSSFKILPSKDIVLDQVGQESMFMIFLTNITPNRRIWEALHMSRNSKLIQKILCAGDEVEENCDYCHLQTDALSLKDDTTYQRLISDLNESQKSAISACLSSSQCNHQSTVDLIWGPPGTGKTKTLGTLLFALLKRNCRTLVCTPTNVAIKEVAYRVLSMVRSSFDGNSDDLFCPLGDILLFGNHEELKVGEDIKDIYLDYRVKQLSMCFRPAIGWRYCFGSMIELLENCVSHYHTFIENQLRKKQERIDDKKTNWTKDDKASDGSESTCKSFLEQPISFESSEGAEYLLNKRRTECLYSLKTLEDSLGKLDWPDVTHEETIRVFCLQTSSLIFSTASCSFKLHSVAMKPLNVLVVDEAAQLMECESIIPLLLKDINHGILVGDECQLPAMVESNVSLGVGFGRSLFERLDLLNYPNHFLNMQYRMHPAISSFPNSQFYLNQILDGPNVMSKNYRKKYLPAPMFGPYAFINIVGGREGFDDAGRSRKNMVEVAVAIKIIRKCFKVWLDSKEKLSIGVVSPYAAQVAAIQDALGQKYDRYDGFDIKVKTIDGFQGGEQDIIILSTVRTNASASLKFISNHQRTNVSLTRARHNLWILGNEKTLVSLDNVWKDLVVDAKKRQCFFDADEDKDLAKSILDAKKELNQLDDLLNADSVIFRNSMWKVLFSDNFLKSFKTLQSEQKKKSIIGLLYKLSSGWRPKRIEVDLHCGSSSQMLKQFKVEGLFIVCSKDIVKESRYTQVLKIWDILPLEDIPKVVKSLDNIFASYTDDFIKCCSEQCLEGKIEAPMTWEKTTDIIKFKNIGNLGNEAEVSNCDERIYVENSKVEESLLLMKFYSLSPVVVSHLLSDHNIDELDLPFEVSDEEREIIHFSRSTFILGRSGTGKTTILTMKLFKKENLHHLALEATYGIKSGAFPCLNHDKEHEESSHGNDKPILRQLFVTASPKLCQAVKHHVVRLKRSICRSNVSAESSPVEEDIDVDTSNQFKNIPDSLINLPANSYPLVITFQKFLMMLDGSLGNSYFERFGVESVALETLMRKKEVTYDRFDSVYWPHFNSQYTKTLDPSRVFCEIMSHIKGCMQALEHGDGKLSRESYVSLSENRASSLSKQKREVIYNIYQSYEKMKMLRGDFDLADIVADLHLRLRTKRYEGDELHFVYIDEVQDLTMCQIALFKYVCPSVEEGFVFCGDTAQTIASGIDFRFQDIKSLFYNKFVLESRKSSYNQGNEKGLVSDTFLLNQNFRTHAGVLKLSQSIIELLFRFFPHSIDSLKPETSLIYGEAPVVLECGNRENAIVTIFGNGGHVDGKVVGFGAEQVILVRDDSARKEILSYVGKQALVLTILECKGLEFQDVLLYNFFGTTPLKNRWRVIYEYMNEKDMLEPAESKSYPSFNDSKHNILCSELKQLYVSITRTRQRLWICENTKEFSIPMFDYWKKKGLVQFKELDDSLAQAMKVASCPDEWKSRGKKLYYQNNFEMATMCFERAGDSYWEKKSKAAGLRATANRLHDFNPEGANATLREAAEIFEDIGMANSAAQCFSDLGDFERAGKLYLQTCEVSDLKRAGDCFNLAGCYETAAQVYARGSFFSDCLTVCAKGRLFEIGFSYIQHWKQNENSDHGMIKSLDINTIEQKFLESCAQNYLDHKDTSSVMKLVKTFYTMDSKRVFLRSLNLLDELLVLEEESGNFLEAVNVAMMLGDIQREADLLGKAGKFKEAFELLLFYILANSLWSSGRKGWPVKQFTHKAELLGRALSFAKEESESFYEHACMEVEVLSNNHKKTSEIMIRLKSSRMHESIRGEIICLWQLLDVHCHLNNSKYVWQENVISDAVEGMILENHLSVETLFHCWTCWKDNIVLILECLPSFKSPDIQQLSSYAKCALNYLGVRKLTCDLNEIYSLLVPDANWVIKLGDRFQKKDGRLVSVDVDSLVSSAQSYWSSELLSVGIAVLRNLDALYKFSVKTDLSDFQQFQPLLHMYEVSEFLLGSKCFSHTHGNLKTLDKFHGLPIDRLLRYIVHLDWKKSLTRGMVFIRTTEACKDLVKKTIYENIKLNDRLTYGQIGRVVVMILGTAGLLNELYVGIMTRFEHNIPWKKFIQQWSSAQEISQRNDSSAELNRVLSLYEALEYTYNVNWMKETDYLSPSCFLYLVERLLLLASCRKGLMFSTKSSFIEWLNYQDENSLANLSLTPVMNMTNVHEFIARIIQELINNQNGSIKWMRKSNLDVKSCLPLFVLRLVVSLCLLHLSTRKYLEPLSTLLGKSHITSQLPLEFCNVLKRGRKVMDLKVIAEALKVIDNPLVIVKLGNSSSKIVCPDAVFVDLMVCRKKELILQMLFPDKVDSVDAESATVIVESSDSSCGSVSMDLCAKFHLVWDGLENLLSTIEKADFNRESPDSNTMKALIIKGWLKLNSSPLLDLLGKCLHFLDIAYKFDFLVHADEELALFHEMKQLFSALNARNVSMTKTKRIANSINLNRRAGIQQRLPLLRIRIDFDNGNHDEAQNVDSDVDSDIDSNESEEDNINDVQVQKVVQVQKGVQVQNAAKNFHGKGKKKNKGGRKSCKQMECALCMRYHDDPEAQRSMQTFKHINQPRENVSMFFRDCEGS